MDRILCGLPWNESPTYLNLIFFITYVFFHWNHIARSVGLSIFFHCRPSIIIYYCLRNVRFPRDATDTFIVVHKAIATIGVKPSVHCLQWTIMNFHNGVLLCFDNLKTPTISDHYLLIYCRNFRVLYCYFFFTVLVMYFHSKVQRI